MVLAENKSNRGDPKVIADNSHPSNSLYHEFESWSIKKARSN